MKRNLEGTAKIPRIVQVMWSGQMPRQVNQQPEMGMPKQWEAQWQEFLRTAHVGWGNPQLMDTIPWDHAKTFLSAFEQVAEACRWPEEEWVGRLLPALRGGMEQYFCRLGPQERQDYQKVKATLLRADAFRMELKRQHFRQCSYQEREGPRRAYSQLKELCRQWLKPEKHTKEEIMELIIQEQLLAMLPPEVQNWVRQHGPQSCIETVALAEDFLMGHRHMGRPWESQVPVPAITTNTLDTEASQQPHSVEAPQKGEREISLMVNEMPPTRTPDVVLLPQGQQEVAGLGLMQAPLKVKEEPNLDQTPTCWENTGAGLLIPPPETVPKPAQQEAIFAPRPEVAEPVPHTPLGSRMLTEIKTEPTQEADSDTDDSFIYPFPDETSQDLETEQQNGPRRNQNQRGKGQGASSQGHLLEAMLRQNSTSDSRISAPYEDHQYAIAEMRSRDLTDPGLLIPPPETVPKPAQQEAIFAPKPEVAEPVPHTPLGSRMLTEIKTEPTQEADSDTDNSFIYPFPDETSQDLETEQQNGPRRNQNQTGEGQGSYSQGKGKTMKKYGRHNPGKKQHLCSECGHMTYYLSDLLKHMKTHLNKELYKCPECGKTYKGQASFEAHKKTHAAPDQTISANGKIETRSWKHQTEDRYVCSECGVSKNTLASLTEHMMVLHKQGKPYECPQCGKTFRRQSNLSRHQELHIHRGNLRGRRRVMPVGVQERGKNNGNSLPLQEAQHSTDIISLSPAILESDPVSSLHLRKLHDEGREPPLRQGVKTLRVVLTKLASSRKGKVHKCPECGYKCDKLAELINHMRVHTKKRPYKCHECGRNFRWPLNLHQHRQNACPQKRPDLSASFAEHQATQTGEEEKSGEAETFPNQEIKMEDEALPVMSNLPEEDAEKESMDHQSEKYLCSQCGHTAEKWLDLVKHKCFDTGEKPFRCNDCGKNFAWLSNLVKHQKTHASQQQTASQVPAAPIAECDVTLSDDEELINIMSKNLQRGGSKSHHQQGKVRTSRAPKKSELASPVNRKGNRYARLEKKHKCPDCGHRAYYLSDLLRHQLTHSRAKSFQCVTCGKAFKQKAALNNHLKSQPSCSASKAKSAGKRVKKSQGEKKHMCSKCGHKSYKLSTHLVHMRTHGDEKPFKCQDCGQTFTWTSTLLRHKKLCHKLEISSRKPSFFKNQKHCKASNKKPKEVKEGNPQPKKTGSPPVTVTQGESPVLTMIRERWRYDKQEQKENTGGENDRPTEETKEDLSGKEAAVRAKLIRFAYCKSAEAEQDQMEVSSSDTAQAGEKPSYKCLTCGESFEKKTDLADHESTHTGPKPSDFNELRKRFSWNHSDLPKDKPANTGPKPHTCCECGKDFFCKDNFVIHLKTHGFENVYECSGCEECFVQQEHLERHQKSHTGQECC